MHPIILKPQKCISNQSIWIAEFSVGFRRLFPFSSPIETKPSLFIRCARFLLRKEYGTTLIWSYSFWWIMFIKDMMHFLICVMKHSECIVSIFQMKDKHQCISTIVPFKNSVWTYSNLWINKDWMFHGYACGGEMSLQWSFPIFLVLKRTVVLIVPFACRRNLKKLHLSIHIMLWHQLSWVFSLCQIWLLPESTCCKCSSPSSLGCLVEWILLRSMLKAAIVKALLYNSTWSVHLHFLTRYS
jgi:hypothetical protein